MKNMSFTQKSDRIKKNKYQLDNYLLDFHPSKIEEAKNKFIEEDFDCGFYVFKGLMKLKISMPQFGKSTLIYWTSRGWNEDESKNKRRKISKDPTTSPMN